MSKYEIGGLKYPSQDKISSRDSTVARSIASSIIPRIPCEEKDEEEAAKILGIIDPNKPVCVYCGRTATHLDHLHPLIQDKKPSGYISELANLVPCCGECNQKKGGKSWEEYMNSRYIIDNFSLGLKDRINRLNEFTNKFPAKWIDFSQWKDFDIIWSHYDNIKNELDAAQKDIDNFKRDHSEYYVTMSKEKTIR